jgi:hypothetical protein
MSQHSAHSLSFLNHSQASLEGDNDRLFNANNSDCSNGGYNNCTDSDIGVGVPDDVSVSVDIDDIVRGVSGIGVGIDRAGGGSSSSGGDGHDIACVDIDTGVCGIVSDIGRDTVWSNVTDPFYCCDVTGISRGCADVRGAGWGSVACVFSGSDIDGDDGVVHSFNGISGRPCCTIVCGAARGSDTGAVHGSGNSEYVGGGGGSRGVIGRDCSCGIGLPV